MKLGVVVKFSLCIHLHIMLLKLGLPLTLVKKPRLSTNVRVGSSGSKRPSQTILTPSLNPKHSFSFSKLHVFTNISLNIIILNLTCFPTSFMLYESLTILQMSAAMQGSSYKTSLALLLASPIQSITIRATALQYVPP